MGKLYLFETPFVCNNTPNKLADYIEDYLNEDASKQEELVHNLIIKMAIDSKVVTRTNDVLYISTDSDTGSWIWWVIHSNMRSLVQEDRYMSLLRTMTSRDQHVVNQVLDLHMTLGTLVPHRVLNTLVNRTIRAVQMIPYDNSEYEGRVLSWNDIHLQTPFLWVLILMQSLIRSSAVLVR